MVYFARVLAATHASNGESASWEAFMMELFPRSTNIPVGRGDKVPQ